MEGWYSNRPSIDQYLDSPGWPIVKWERLESQYALSDNWITVRRDVCRMPDGRKVDPYYVLERPDYCMIFPITGDNEVVMVRQYRHAAEVISLELPGGLFEPGESEPETAARRELLEETGYGDGVFRQLGTLYPNPAVQDNRAHCFLAREVKLIGGQTLDHSEDIEVVRVPVAGIENLLDSGLIKHAVHLGCIHLALRALKGEKDE